MSPALRRLWKLCCSLKLAIVLASATTLVAMTGSLVLEDHPGVFRTMDRHILFDWLAGIGRQHPGLSVWVLLSGVLLVLLGLNTLCCFIDWLRHLRGRWRKTGEYLLHLGFVLVLIAYLWGSLAGSRSQGLLLRQGQLRQVPGMPGYFLRLGRTRTVFDNEGRLVDLRTHLTLLRGDNPVARHVVHINSPLLWHGLDVLAASFTQQVTGFRFFLAGRGLVTLSPGSSLQLPAGTLQVLRFYPAAGRLTDGRVIPLPGQQYQPALQLAWHPHEGSPWRGWYFPVTAPPPPVLQRAGVRLLPAAPLLRYVPLFTVNRDPGARLAFAGALLMAAGVMLTLLSFYAKRRRGDRPEVS